MSEVAASYMTIPSMKPYLDYLLDNGAAEHVKVKWGKGYRWVVIIGGKKYTYKGGHDINKNLKKKIVPLYISMSDKSLNNNSKNKLIIDDIVAPDGDDDKYGIKARLSKPARRLRRKTQTKVIQNWVKQNRDDFKQTDKMINVTVSITFVNPNSGESYTQSYTIPTIIVKGGKRRVANAISKATRELADKIGSYPREIEDMVLETVIVNDVPQDLKQFNDLKLFGTLLNYHGYGLMANLNATTKSCVLDYILDMLNNPDETNRNKCIKRLTKEVLMLELGMQNENEGCSLSQLMVFFDKHKITFYAVDFRFFTVEHNKDRGYSRMNNYPILYFMVSSNHLYPIPDKHVQLSISQINKCGGKPYVPAPKDLVKPDNKKIQVLYELSHLRCFMQNPNYKGYRIICTDLGGVDKLFTDFVVNGDIYNSGIKMNNHKITRFEINDMIVEENPQYHAVQASIDTLNDHVKSEKDKYHYNEHSLHSLAVEYFNKEFNNDIFSFLAPEVMEVLESCKNAPPTEFYRTDAEVAFDKNKCYANILKWGDKFGWPKLTAIDEIQPYDGQPISTGLYYVVTDNDMPFHGNDFYIDNIVQNALDAGLIQQTDIKYQIRASLKLDKNHFHAFVDSVFKNFTEPKQAIVAFIGAMFGKNYYTYNRDYFEGNIDTAIQMYMQHPDEVNVKCIYDTSKIRHVDGVHLLSTDNVGVSKSIAASIENNQAVAPVAFHVNVSKKTKLFMNALIIQKKIYDNANWEMWEADQLVKAHNPNAELCGRKVDLLAYRNITNPVPTSDRWGDIKKVKPPKVKSENIVERKHKNKSDVLSLEFKAWKYIDEVNIENLLEQGGLITGMAGTGKSTHLKNFKAKLVETRNDIVHQLCAVCAPTHKACKIIGGKTIHKLFGIHPKDYTFDYKLIKALVNDGITHILVDEVSMISSQMWCLLAHIQKQYGFVFIGFGDFKQLKPVKEETINFENLTIVKQLFNYTRCELTTVHRFDDNELLQDAHACANGERIDITKYGTDEHDLCLAWSNDCVKALNKRWNEHYAQNHSETITVNGHEKTTIILHRDLELLAYQTPPGCLYSNAESLKVVKWETKQVQITDEDGKTKSKTITEIHLENDDGLIIKLDSSKMIDFRPAYALTAHKAQGASFNRPYTIYEHEKMKHDMLYVSLTRTRKKEYVNFGDISTVKPYQGSIYRVSLSGKSYIGSAKDVKERWTEHKQGKGHSKFIRALQDHGHKAFKWEVLETISYSDVNDLYRLEDSYIDEYNSIQCGYNTRYNIKQHTTEVNV